MRTAVEVHLSRAQRYALTIGLIVALFLAWTFGSYFLSLYAVNRATSNTITAIQLCQSSNEFRSDNIELWHKLIKITKPHPHHHHHMTPYQRQKRARSVRKLKRIINRVFRPRNCTAIINQGKRNG